MTHKQDPALHCAHPSGLIPLIHPVQIPLQSPGCFISSLVWAVEPCVPLCGARQPHSAELCCHLVNQGPPWCRGGLVAEPWWLCQARARSPPERGTHRNCPFGWKGGNKAPLSQLLAGKGGILYKPIMNWESKLTAVLFINICKDEKCVFPWYFSKNRLLCWESFMHV